MTAEVSQTELEALQEADGDVRVVDVRSPAAYRRGHIPGSVNVPFDALADRVTDLAGAEHVVTVCPHGEASVQAARLVAAYEGFDGEVASLSCGVTGWDGDLAAGDAGDAAEDVGADAPF